MVVVLTSVGFLSGAFLACVGLLTKERIALNKKRETEHAIIKVIPGATQTLKYYEEKELTLYGGKDNDGNLLGFAIFGKGIGFQDLITFMVGTDPSLNRINSLVILEQKETPGLGAKISSEEAYLQFWENKNCSGPLSLRKPAISSPGELGPSEINTITGATISSEAVLKMVNNAIKKVKQLIKQGNIIIEEQDAS
jgi:RnfABCDGE-type electron transport complex G subunit